MKHLHKIVLLFCLLMAGCIAEPQTACELEPKANVTLYFSYEDQHNQEVFNTTIRDVQLFLFDQQARLAYRFEQELSKNGAMGTISLSLAPGVYRLVVLGNAKSNTLTNLTIGDHIDQGLIEQHKTTSGFVTKGDPLFYGPLETQTPFMLVVPTTGSITNALTFRTAHIEVAVYVTGMIDPINRSANLSPIVELTNLAAGYNFILTTQVPLVTYQQTAQPITINGLATQVCEFNTPLFTLNNEINVIIRKASDNQVLERIRLNEFIEQHYTNMDLSSSSTIQIQLEFKYLKGEIIASIPTWIDEPIYPVVQ